MVVNERMICHAIIGKNPLKERIMTVDVTATFIAPLLEFSSKKLLYSLYQVLVVVVFLYTIFCMIIHIQWAHMWQMAEVYAYTVDLEIFV